VSRQQQTKLSLNKALLVKFGRPRTPADQQHHHYSTLVHIITGSITSSITTSNTTTQIHPAHELSNKGGFTTSSTPSINQTSKTKTKMVT
jgi:hypothetical protein